MKRLNYFLSIIVALFFIACKHNTKHLSENKLTKSHFINPAFTNFDIPFTKYNIQAETGDTIYSESGSILLFPANAFLDKDGNVIKGQVTILYREISNPIDMFISGIPMEYDSAGTKYTFESAAMCEVYANKGNVSLFVNPQNKPEINLVSKNSSDGFNIYVLDTIHKSWNYKGESVVTKIVNQDPNLQKDKRLTNADIQLIKPIKASGDRPILEIEIIPGSLPELNEYNNLKFEISEEEKNFDSTNVNIEWENVELTNTSKVGKYNVTFSKGKKKVSYIVKPVFEGKNYDEALKIFEQKHKKHYELKSERIISENLRKKEAKAIEQKVMDENKKIAKENEKIQKMNLITENRNRSMKAQNERVKKVNSLIEIRNRETKTQYDELQSNLKMLQENPKKYIEEITKKQKEIDRIEYLNGGERMETQIIRTFQMEQFGVWNCDRQFVNIGLPLLAKFEDNSGNKLILDAVTVVYGSYNTLRRFDNNKIKLFPNQRRQMIFAVINDKLVYLNYKEFEKYQISSDTKELEFKMNVHSEKITSYEEFKKIVGI